MGDVLKFCYLSFCFLVMSCAGNDAKKIEKQENKESINIETQSEKSQKIILFFGNSLTAGMGLEVEEAFPALIQKKLDSALLSINTLYIQKIHECDTK